jgi:hypothetical protein
MSFDAASKISTPRETDSFALGYSRNADGTTSGYHMLP